MRILAMAAAAASVVAAAVAEDSEAELLEVLAASRSDAGFVSVLRDRELLAGQARACADGAVGAGLLSGSLGAGYFDSVLELLRACMERGVAVDKGVQHKANQMRQMITKVTAQLQAAEQQQRQQQQQQESVVAPAFEWAQSADAVFVGVKFAHKLDAPACLDLVDEDVSIETGRVVLQATCNGKHKVFRLELELLDDIDADKSAWSMASVGRGTLTLRKAESVRWHKLLKGDARPRNMHTWWEMQEKFADELDRLDDALAEASSKGKKGEDEAQEQGKGNGKGNGQEGEKKEEEKEEEEGEEEEVSIAEREREEQRQHLRKQAKKEGKRASKEFKKQAKAADAAHTEAVNALEGRLAEERKALTAANAAKLADIAEAKKAALAEVEDRLKAALEQLDAGSPLGGLLEGLTSMLFGAAKAEL